MTERQVDIRSSLQFRVCRFRQWRPLTRRQSPSPGLALHSSSHPNHFIRVLLETEIPQLSRLLRCWQFVFVPFVYFAAASDTHMCRDWGFQTPGHTLLVAWPVVLTREFGLVGPSLAATVANRCWVESAWSSSWRPLFPWRTWNASRVDLGRMALLQS